MHYYAGNAAMDILLNSKNERHTTELAMLRGARLVTASETRPGKAWDEARVNSMTGGDQITARFMRQDDFTYKPEFKLLLSGNHKPVLSTLNDACRRRFHILPFTYKPPKLDNGLKERLREEYPRILNWAIQGALDWQEHGLVVPARVRAETDVYFTSQDLFGAWLEERCVQDPKFSESNQKLFQDWKQYCQDRGEHEGTSRALADKLAERGFRRIKDEGAVVGRGFAGLRAQPKC